MLGSAHLETKEKVEMDGVGGAGDLPRVLVGVCLGAGNSRPGGCQGDHSGGVECERSGRIRGS